MLTREEVMRMTREAGIFYNGSLADLSAQQDRVYRAIELAFAAGAAAAREKAAEEGFAVACPQCEFRVAAAIRARKD